MDKMEVVSPTGTPRVVVAMPAYNEEKYVGSMVLSARQYAGEVIVIDDGSKDHTARIASLAGATVISHGTNKGYGSSIQMILAEAAKRKPDVLVVIDADGQHNSEEIPRLVKAVLEGNDLVIGSRKLQKDTNTPLYRRFGQKVLLYLTNFQSGKKLTDTESGFRAFSQKAIDVLVVGEGNMAASAETVVLAADKGLKIYEVPISIIYTPDGSTLNPIRHGLQVLGSLMLIISATRLVFMYWLGGAALITGGMYLFLWVVENYYKFHVIAPGRSIASVLFILIGVQSIFTGVLLKRLSKIKKWNH